MIRYIVCFFAVVSVMLLGCEAQDKTLKIVEEMQSSGREVQTNVSQLRMDQKTVEDRFKDLNTRIDGLQAKIDGLVVQKAGEDGIVIQQALVTIKSLQTQLEMISGKKPIADPISTPSSPLVLKKANP